MKIAAIRAYHTCPFNIYTGGKTPVARRLETLSHLIAARLSTVVPQSATFVPTGREMRRSASFTQVGTLRRLKYFPLEHTVFFRGQRFWRHSGPLSHSGRRRRGLYSRKVLYLDFLPLSHYFKRYKIKGSHNAAHTHRHLWRTGARASKLA